MKNICIKCGVDLYITPNFICQKHPKECKGIMLPKETLQEWADNEEQKQHLIDMMKADEELGLYEEPKQIKCYCGHTTYCDCGPLEELKEETIENIKLEEVLGSSMCQYTVIENKLATIYRNQEQILKAIKMLNKK